MNSVVKLVTSVAPLLRMTLLALTINYQLSIINYYEERTLAENPALRHYRAHGHRHHPGHYFVHRGDVAKEARNSGFSKMRRPS